MPVRTRFDWGSLSPRRLLMAVAVIIGLCPMPSVAVEPADTVVAIARFTVWPDEVDYGLSFRMCLRDDDPAIASFLSLRGTLIHGRPLSLHSVEPGAFGSEACQVAFFSSGLAEPSDIQSISLRPVLTVSAQPGFVKAGGIVEITDPHAEDRLLVSNVTLGRHPLRLRAPLLEVAGRVIE
ncbi:MAG: YfiR family protein [Pseudomonadota bacterium]